MAWYDVLFQVGRWNGSATEPVADDKRLPTYDRRVQGGVKAWPFTVTSTASPAVLNPSASGKSIRVLWITAGVDPSGQTFPRIIATLPNAALGQSEIYRVRGGTAHWEPFEGAADQPLTISISANATVDGTVHYEEF